MSSENLFSPEWFHELLQCSFDNPVKKCSPKAQKFSAPSPKSLLLFFRNNSLFIIKLFFLNSASGRVQCSFDNPAKKFALEERLFSLSDSFFLAIET